jgi:hypothetical protein
MPFKRTTPGRPIGCLGVGRPQGLFLATIDYYFCVCLHFININNS